MVYFQNTYWVLAIYLGSVLGNFANKSIAVSTSQRLIAKLKQTNILLDNRLDNQEKIYKIRTQFRREHFHCIYKALACFAKHEKKWRSKRKNQSGQAYPIKTATDTGIQKWKRLEDRWTHKHEKDLHILRYGKKKLYLKVGAGSENSKRILWQNNKTRSLWIST